ncbi:MAG: kelch repeat-containing protein [Terracidiphilus sp.]
MTKQLAGSACNVRFAGMSVSSRSSGDRNLSAFIETSRPRLAWARGVVSFGAALMLLGAFCAPAKAQTLAPNWYEQSPLASPPERYIHAMTYDGAHGQVVLFGGFGEGGYLNDTWLWNGMTWAQANPSNSPSPRAAHAMVYDAAHGQVVLFGGLNGAANSWANDTWVWNGTNWIQQSPANSPSARDADVMVYDAAQGYVLLFGGSAGGFAQNDTWVWNGSNWAQQSPANSPSARTDYSMVYDAAHGQVVLFGGLNGGYLSDTWVWNGTNWIQQSPANTPPARYAQGMAYDAALGEVVMWGGEGSSGYLNDTWVWNGSNWTQQTTASSPAGRVAPNAITYDAANDQLLLFGGYGSGGQFSDTWSWGTSQNFGNVNVCPSGQATPVPCSKTLTLTYNISTTNDFGVPKVVTQGITGLDFQQGSGSTCTGAITAGSSCTVNVTFAPKAPGLRRGAVELFDSSGNLLTTTLIYGNGQGPVTAFGPGTQTTVNTGSNSLTLPNGVAVDAAGDIFIADGGAGYNGKVVEVPASGTPTTVGSGLDYPQGLAVDGAGDLFIADNNLQRVVEVTPAGVQTEMSFGLSAQLGVAVDGAGDLFVSDFNAQVVLEAPPGCTSSACTSVVYSAESGFHPIGLAVDGAGDLFVADFPDSPPGKVVEIPAGCTSSACQTTVGTGWSQPEAVAVDAAGDVFVADEFPQVVEVPAGCANNNNNCQITVSGILAYGVAVDAKGDVFLPERNGTQVAEINQSQPPSLNFPTATDVGSSDTTDGASLVSLQNVGNTTLSFPIPSSGNNPSIGPDFSVYSNGTGDCPLTTASSSSPGTLAVGGKCVYSVTFAPMTAGSLSESLVLTDDNLNAISPSPAATQAIGLTGTGLATNYTFTVSIAGSGSGTLSGTNCSTGSYSPGTTVTCTETPAVGSQFTGWSGGTCSGTGSCSFSLSGNSTVVANFSLPYPLTLTEVGTGTGTVTDNQSQISCSRANGATTGTCSGIYLSGSLVTLTANATGTSIFAGWGGDCASAGASATCNVTINSPLNVSATFVAPGPTQPGALEPITAGVVYGQGGSFSSGTANNGGTTANSLGALGGVVADAGGNLYVADDQNDRVLFFPSGSTTATRVYGQNGSFTSSGPNNGGVSANSLSTPQGLALDGSGNLYVADEYNNRVLFYPAGSTTATRVYGQGGSFTTNAANYNGVSANGLFSPYGLAVDASGDLYVSDYGNSRALYYPAGSTTATRVYGQNGSFTSNNVNNGGISANSLNQPTGVALDSSGDLYVADIYNNRVLFFPYNSTTATGVYGQNGSFSSGAANNGGVSASSLNNPMYPALDSAGDLYVVDRSNNRMLFYPFGSTTATRVYGQLGSFTSTSANNGGITANSFSQPWAVALDNSGNVYVTDYSNNRVLEYGPFGNVNVCPSGQGAPAPCSGTFTMSYSAAANTNIGATQVVTQGVTGLDFALAGGGTCSGAISAGNSCTLNVNFIPLVPGLRTGAVNLYDNSGNLLATEPVYGIGQAPEAIFGPGVQTVEPTTGLHYNVGLAVDASGNLYIADYVAAKVVKVTPGGVQSTVLSAYTSAPGQTPAPIGVAVDGAGDLFIDDLYLPYAVKVTPSGVQSTVGSGLNYPIGIALDGAGDVFIGDQNNARVVEVAPDGVQTTVPATGLQLPWGVALDAAGDVFIADGGQNGDPPKVVEYSPSSGQTTTVPVTGLSQPYDLAVDAAGDLFIADAPNSRVVEIPAGGGSQTTVGTGLGYPSGVTVDAAGDVFIGDQGSGQVFEVNRSQLPSLSFAVTAVSNTSVDSPQLISLQNIGNQPLTGTLALTLGTNFIENAGSTCSGSGFSLIPGASCYESFSFTPQSTGLLSGAADFSDNTLNLAPAVVLQAVNLNGSSSASGSSAGVVPNVVGMTQSAATSALTTAGLTLGTVTTQYSDSEPAGSVIGENPAAGAPATLGTAVALVTSVGAAPTPAPNPLSLLNNYFVTGDYAAAGVTLRGTGHSGMATGTINIPDSTTDPGVSQGVPDGADIIDGYLYWVALENTPSPSANNGTFLGFPITGQQIGTDTPFTDGALTGTLRVYRADVNTYFPVYANGSGVRYGSGAFTVSLPDSGGTGFPVTEGASLVVIRDDAERAGSL